MPLYRVVAKLQAAGPHRSPLVGPPWLPGAMARETTEAWIQLATRIPKSLHRKLKLHCVSAETSVMDFVTKAIEEKLARAWCRSEASGDEGVGPFSSSPRQM